jgi:uncharacterized BrkB/YihY/UPF0761 family membrane protein
MKTFFTFIFIFGSICLAGGVICTLIHDYWPEKWKRKEKKKKFKK